VTKKLLDFQASISDVKQVNPLFSTCNVRVLYTGKNRNLSIITKEAVDKALATLPNIPIVGEYSEENKDYKGHGGAIDLDSYKYIHTTKPYGVVPESATYEWESVKGADGATRDYLVIKGCYLWTGRYEEAYDVIQNGKGQSMEIEVTDGFWHEEEEAYQIDNFVFSALCILGDDVEPAFEDANITAYSLDRDSFRKEFSSMMKELKSSLSKEKEVGDTMLKELLEKYSLTMEDITAKGIDLTEISEDEVEAKIIEVFEIEVKDEEAPKVDAGEEVVEGNEVQPEGEQVTDEEPVNEEEQPEVVVEETKPEGEEVTEVEETEVTENPEGEVTEQPEGEEVVVEETEVVEETVDVEALQARIQELEGQLEEFEALKEFKLNVEKEKHESEAQKLFGDFQLTAEDVEGLDIHKFSLEEIEEKCYAILGRKMASKKNFSKKEESNIRIQVESENKDEQETPYGGLFEKFNK
jgi:hypothetical protein